MDLFDDALPVPEIRTRLEQLAQVAEPPYQQAIKSALDRLDQQAEVIAQVRRMRTLQRRYFDDRTQETLIASKDQERKVDSMIKE